MNKKKEEKVVEKVVKKPVQFYVKGEHASIERRDMPIIWDNTQKAVEWLAKNKFDPNDIEINGDKPENWNLCFNIKEETTLQEEISKVLV